MHDQHQRERTITLRHPHLALERQCGGIESPVARARPACRTRPAIQQLRTIDRLGDEIGVRAKRDTMSILAAAIVERADGKRAGTGRIGQIECCGLLGPPLPIEWVGPTRHEQEHRSRNQHRCTQRRHPKVNIESGGVGSTHPHQRATAEDDCDQPGSGERRHRTAEHERDGTRGKCHSPPQLHRPAAQQRNHDHHGQRRNDGECKASERTETAFHSEVGYREQQQKGAGERPPQNDQRARRAQQAALRSDPSALQ
ncbi:MAG: hypothetical protein HC809_13715 [Gammaproteobacteria bacterium]|nr:hypothetical protein [Gammaproteobacteria bacterium]